MKTRDIVDPPSDGEELIIEQVGTLGRVRLNRPKALNSLTLSMVRGMRRALDAFAEDDAVEVVLVTGEGGRGLCAGGDIRAIHESGRAGTDLAMTFWREEFQLDAIIGGYRKPYVVIMDGIVMGGGVGIAAHGRHRIVTERTRLAMPETGIGYFPDVGATWLLSRGQGEFGTYVGLTGQQIGAADAIAAGLADLFIPAAELPGLIEALAAAPAHGDAGAVSRILNRFSRTAPDGISQRDRAAIDRVFAFDRVEETFAALAGEATPFADETLALLRSRSPTSLKLALRLLRLGRASAGLDECLDRELAACSGILSNRDFYEGIRAAVLDKDRNPHWSPATLEAVTGEAVEAYLDASSLALFAAPGHQEKSHG